MKGGMSVAAALLVKQKEQASEKAIYIGDYCVIKFDEIVSFQKRFVPDIKTIKIKQVQSISL